MGAYTEVGCLYVVMVNLGVSHALLPFLLPPGESASMLRPLSAVLRPLSAVLRALRQQRDAQPALALSGPRHLK